MICKNDSQLKIASGCYWDIQTDQQITIKEESNYMTCIFTIFAVTIS